MIYSVVICDYLVLNFVGFGQITIVECMYLKILVGFLQYMYILFVANLNDLINVLY